MWRAVAVITVVPGLTLACGAQQAAPRADRAQAPATTEAAGALASGNAAAPELASVEGKVLEAMDSGGYTYLRLDTADGELWAAVGQAHVETGSRVTVANAMRMDGFESRTLKRSFDHIVFGNLASEGAAALPAGHPAVAGAPPAPRAMGASQSAEDAGQIQVAKAEGKDGHTVAELFAKKGALQGQEVAVRGKVVKFNPAIMGRNWLHLRDGSGSAAAHDDDITVTTTDTVAVGDVVLVRGTLAVDRDFGAGYAYPVILEDAKVVK